MSGCGDAAELTPAIAVPVSPFPTPTLLFANFQACGDAGLCEENVLSQSFSMRLAPVALVLVASLASSRTAVAADAAVVVAAAGELPQVVVTASRFNEAFNPELAVGTSVISAEDIARSGATNVYDALRSLGGIHTRSNGFGTPDDTIDMRGFGVTGDQNTLVLVDGMRVSENELQSARLSALPLSSIERIEIVRGGGAVLYGSGATGGVINVITKAAQAGAKSVNLGVLTGSFGTTDMRADVGLAGAGVAFDFAANRLTTDNYRVNNASGKENQSGRLRFFGENGEVGLRVGSERQHAQLPGVRSAAQFISDPRGANTPNDWADTDANRYVAYGVYRFDTVEIAADVFRRDKVDRFYNDFGGGVTQFTRSGTSVEGVSPRARIDAPLFGMANQLVVGFDGSRWKYRNQQALLFAGTASEADLGTASLSSDETGTQGNRAWYFKNDVQAGNVRVSFGARREVVDLDTQNPLGFPALARTQLHRKLHAEELGAVWSFAPRWLLSGRVGNSYRIGNIDENRNRFPTPGFLLPQTSRDAEVGIAYASRPVDAGIRLFRHRLDNEIMFVAAPAPVFGNNINLSPTRREGIEVNAKWRPNPDIDVSAFYTRVRARFVSGTFFGIDVTGREVPVVPTQRATLSGNWRITPNDAVNLGWQYVGSQIYDNDQPNALGARIPAYSTIDAKYTRRIGNVDISLIGTNLGNLAYYSYGVIRAGTAVTSVYPERRRGVFMMVSARF